MLPFTYFFCQKAKAPPHHLTQCTGSKSRPNSEPLQPNLGPGAYQPWKSPEFKDGHVAAVPWRFRHPMTEPPCVDSSQDCVECLGVGGLGRSLLVRSSARMRSELGVSRYLFDDFRGCYVSLTVLSSSSGTVRYFRCWASGMLITANTHFGVPLTWNSSSA